jgi:CheY-like chemotaxis protein
MPTTVLIVDDQEIVRMFMESFLRHLGYKTITAVSGEDGLFCFSAHQAEIDLVISDIVMPGMSGFKMVESIRALQPKIPVLFISGTVDELPKWADMTCSVLRKPFAAENVKAAVEKCLSGRP